MAEITISGLSDVLDKLKQLDDTMQTKVFKRATQAGAKVILPIAEAAAPRHTGFLASQIKIRSSSRPSQGVFKSSVGVGQKDWTGPAFYASFVLFGHKVGSRKLGDNRKKVPANDFLKQSAATAGEAAAQAIIQTIAEGIESVSQK